MFRRTCWLAQVTAVMFAAACSSAGGTTTIVSVVGYTVVTKTVPPATAPVGASVPIAFTVTEHESDGSSRPASGKSFTATVTTGGGTINGAASATLTTGTDGSVAATWILGSTLGMQTVRGSVSSTQYMDITLAATAAPVGGADTTHLSVTTTSPSIVQRDTTLDVQVIGTGFDNGSQASFQLQGVLDARVHVNATKFVTSTQLTANLTIAATATTGKYDAVVVTVVGKKGIGSELLAITLKAQALVGGSNANGVNAAGVVVGTGPSAQCAAFPHIPMLWQADGTPVALPTGSACGGAANAINSVGVVLGSSISGTSPSVSVLWSPSGSGYVITQLGAAPDGTVPNRLGALNDSGQVAGWTADGRMYWWSLATGWLQMLSPAGATLCDVTYGINNLGAIAARCMVAGVTEAYYWSNHTATPVLLPRASASSAPEPWAINDSGVIVGGDPIGALRWAPSGGGYTVARLPDLGYGSFAEAISTDGTIAGYVQTDAAGTTHLAVIWPSSGGFITGDLLLGGIWAEAVGIANTPGGLVIVGHQGAPSSGSRAVLWRRM